MSSSANQNRVRLNLARAFLALSCFFSSLDAPCLEAPSLEAEAAFHSIKVERGMCENPEPIFGLEAEVEWCGAYAGIEALYDLSDINGRKGRYNEITPFAGYSNDFFSWLTLGAEYRFKQEVGEHTHEVEAYAECPLAWATPFLSFNFDVGRDAGALYGVVGVERSFAALSWLDVVADAGFGYGNAKRNEADFGRDAIGARDIYIGFACRCKLCEHVRLCPYCRGYYQLTEAAQDEYRPFYVDAGCALAADF